MILKIKKRTIFILLKTMEHERDVDGNDGEKLFTLFLLFTGKGGGAPKREAIIRASATI